MLTAEQIVAAHKANIETLFGLTNKAFEGVEKLVELNLQVAKTALSEAADTTSAALSVKYAPELLALRMDAELDFASANALERRVTDELAQRPSIRHLCLFALPINRIDVTGVEAFIRLRALLQSHGGTLHVTGIKLPVQHTLDNAGALAPGPNFALYRTDAEAIAALQRLAPPDAGNPVSAPQSDTSGPAQPLPKL